MITKSHKALILLQKHAFRIIANLHNTPVYVTSTSDITKHFHIFSLPYLAKYLTCTIFALFILAQIPLGLAQYFPVGINFFCMFQIVFSC